MLSLVRANANFRNFMFFQGFAFIGRGIFGIFLMWVVHYQYHNPIYTGIAGFMFTFPNVISFISGPLVDKGNKVTLLRFSCLLQLLVVGVLLVIPAQSYPGVWVLHIAILVYCLAGMVANPAGAALLPQIVAPEELIQANAVIRIFSTCIGLLLGGFVYLALAQGVGFQVVYGLNTAVLVVALVFSVFIRVARVPLPASAKSSSISHYISDLKQGWHLVGQGIVLHLMIAVTVRHLFMEIAAVNLPMLADTHGGAGAGYMLLMAIAMAGSLIGNYLSRVLEGKLKIVHIMTFGHILSGVLRFLFAYYITSDFRLALWLHALFAGAGATINIFFQTLTQKLPPPEMVGRVNAIATSLFSAAAALGALVGGALGALLPRVEMVFLLQGASYVAIGLLLLFSRGIRELPKINDITPMWDNDNVKGAL